MPVPTRAEDDQVTVPANASIDAPYELLEPLPRALWLPGLITSAGERGARLRDAERWLGELQAGALPALDADFGDAEATRPLRATVGELGLPALCRGVPSLAEQVLRTLLWHLDRIVDKQPLRSREAAIAEVVAEFRDAWHDETQGIDEDLALLLGLGELGELRWDELRGHLTSRPFAVARQAAELLQQLPELNELIRRLGRAERSVAPWRPPPEQASPQAAPPQALRAVETRLPEAPGEITGVRLSSRLEHMLGSEAVMLRHPVLKKLWRARHAEARLLSFDTEAVLVDWRPDPEAAAKVHAALAEPEPLARGPIIVCLDTSGSMRGAPEQIAKATVIAALRAAHETRRGCRLVAFGGPGELVERDLHAGPQGLHALMELMGQAFDGGTDIQTPIERAIESVHDARWASADILLVSDGEFGCVPATLQRLDDAREGLGLRVQGVLVGDRETMGLLEVCDAIHWVRDWRRYAEAAERGEGRTSALGGFSPVHSKSLTALYFPNALSGRASRHAPPDATPRDPAPATAFVGFAPAAPGKRSA